MPQRVISSRLPHSDLSRQSEFSSWTSRRLRARVPATLDEVSGNAHLVTGDAAVLVLRHS